MMGIDTSKDAIFWKENYTSNNEVKGLQGGEGRVNKDVQYLESCESSELEKEDIFPLSF